MSGGELTIIESLTHLGLTNNEAKIYLYLVKNPNSNGYEISKATAISRSLVYSGLEKMKNMNFIDLSKSKTSSYIVKSIDEIEHSVTKNIEDSLENLRVSLTSIQPQQNEEPFITITDKNSQLKKISFMVKTAKKYLYISAGTRELEWLKKDLFNLPTSIDVHIFSFTNLTEYSERFNTYSKNMDLSFIQSEENLKNNWRILIIKDKKEMLLCGGENFDTQAAIFTKNKMMVRFAIEHFIHDVKIFNIEKNFNIMDDSHLIFNK